MIEHVSIGDQPCAIVIRAHYHDDGIKFFTDDSETLQVGYMNRDKGYLIRPHLHHPVTRSIEYTNEVLVIKTGRVKVDFYDEHQIYSKSVVLEQGDLILLTKFGHGFEMLEDSEMFEIKQGPYAGSKDKLRF